jgi:hypothetical protein
MGARSADLAQRLEAANQVLVAAVRDATPTAWRRPVGNGDERAAGVVAHHVAGDYAATLGWIRSVLESGHLPPLREEDVHAANAAHAAANIDVERESTASLLEVQGARLADLMRSLDDSALSVSSATEMLGRRWQVDELCEAAVRHVEVHTAAVLAAA